MPRSYKRKIEKGNWSTELLMEAMSCVKNKITSIRKAALHYNIPYSKLQEKLKTDNIRPAILGRPSIFTPDEETEMSKHLLNLSNLFYGMSPIQLISAVYEYAEKKYIKHPFNIQKQLAGVDWFYNFIRKNPEVTVRKPEAMSMNRITAFNKVEIGLFFQNLETLIIKYKFCPTKIYNMDETGITTAQDPG